jgi:hypothetical protein
MTKGLLMATFDFSNVAADEFYDWYETEHIPERERVPGFLACRRWVSVDGRKLSVATYDLENVAVLRSPAYRAIAYENLSPWSKRMTAKAEILVRFEGEQTLPGEQLPPPDAGALLLNAMNVDPAHEADFNAWYDQEHVPALAAVPGTLCARRFRATSTSNHHHVAIYHLTSAAVTESDAWRKAVQTPWTERIRPHYRERLRILCEPSRK